MTNSIGPDPMNPTRPAVWMFSGQGSQYYGMGAELYREDPTFRATVDQLSDFTRPLIGVSVAEMVYNYRGNRFDPFDRTLYTHPALFIVQYAMDRLLRRRGHAPDCVLGYSLGEFVAYAVSGVLDWQDALRMLVRHADILERGASPGRMLTILADPAVYWDRRHRFPAVELAAVNSPRHFVVTGDSLEVESLHAELERSTIDSVLLPVRMAFHSSALGALEAEFLRAFERLPIGQPRTPIASAERGEIIDAVRPESFWSVTRNPIRFQEIIGVLERRGPNLYVDLGPSGTLAGFCRQILGQPSRSEAVPTLTAFGHDLRSVGSAEEKLRSGRRLVRSPGPGGDDRPSGVAR